MSNPITIEQLKQALPVKVKQSVNQVLVDQVNSRLNHPETWEVFKDNLLSYGEVMREGRFKVESYINAIKYVSFKLLGCTNKDAYIKTFPDKYQNFLMQGISAKDISSYSTAFNKSKLVNLIFEQTLIPTHVLNAPMFQQALNTQAELMMSANSEKVRSDAANSILTHLKRPEVQKVELDLGVKQDKTLDTLRATTLKLVQTQKDLLNSKTHNAKQIASTPLTIAKDPDAA